MLLFLIGYPRVGKTTIGKKLAQFLKVEFYDTDSLILENTNEKTIPELFSKIGEEQFRRLEHQVLLSLKNKDKAVVATGGGLVTLSENQTILKQCGMVVWLQISLDTLLQRLKVKPLSFIGSDCLLDFLKNRKSIYQSLCDTLLDITDEKVALAQLECIWKKINEKQFW